MGIIKESIKIERPTDQVFNYTIDAKNWPKWQPFPESEQTSSGPIKIGSTTKGKIHLMGLSMKWTAQVTEYEQDKKFGKDIVSGSVRIGQHNTYESIENATIFSILYEMKVGGLMKPFSPLVESAMRKASAQALFKLKNILETHN